MPKGSRKYFKSRGTKVAYFVDQMRSAFPEIAHRFGTAHGFRLMFIESRVLLDVLTTLLDDGITALPIHDAIIVPMSKAERAKAVMLASFRRIVGIEGDVKEQP